MIRPWNPIIVPLDRVGKEEAIEIIRELERKVYGFSLGTILLKYGVSLIKEFVDKMGCALKLMVDLQLAGTPGFIKECVQLYTDVNIHFIVVNGYSGFEGIKAAVSNSPLGKIVVGTVLSSIDNAEVHLLFGAPPEVKVVQFAHYAQEARAYGIYCLARELEILSQYPAFGGLSKFAVGIRPHWYPDPGDHKIVLTPKRAMELGATFLIIGAPILKASNKAEAVERIVEEIRGAASK